MASTPSPPHNFAYYPIPKETKCEEPYVPDKGQNPPLRGMSLVVAAAVAGNVGFVQKYLWKNAKFGTIKDMPGLGAFQRVFDPVVIPLADDSQGGPTMLPLEEKLLTPPPLDLPGRFHSAADYHRAYQSGTVTPLQVVEALLPLMRRGQSPPGKYEKAWMDCHGRTDLALAAAKASTARWAAGTPLGILDGVPIGVKDDVLVEGYVSHNGMRYQPSVPWFSPAKETAWPVRKLEEAGAVVVGKLNMHELGSDTSGCNANWGTPTNWHNQSYYPGGSSSGAGSALSAGMVPIAVGTDAGGSIRMPCAFNGIYGLKPSQHRTLHMNSTMCVTGPIAANVADLTIAYRLMAQPNPNSDVQGKFAVSQPPDPSSKKLIGVYKDWFEAADPDVVKACRQTIDYLVQKKGYEVLDISIPHMKEAGLAHAITTVSEMADLARSRTPNPANFTSIVTHVNTVLMKVASQTDAATYLKCQQLRGLIMQHLAFLYRTHPGLLILSPTSPLRGWKISPGDETYGFSDANITIANMRFVFLSNLTGCPSVTCPVGYVEPELGEGRLPVGLMAMGEWGAEEQLLSFAADTEEYLHDGYPGGRIQPNGWLDVLELAKKAGAESDGGVSKPAVESAERA